MKNLLLLASLISSAAFGLVSGNVNYSDESGNLNYGGNVNYDQLIQQTKSFDVQMNNSNNLFIEVNGLSNIAADSYVAIFHVTQMGKSTREVNDLLNERINAVKTAVKAKLPSAKIFVDMLSFVPVYEYEIDKKLFSKDTYNEIPKGFDLKKNIHIQYDDSEMLSDFISICTESEIYDLVKVDYICNDLEQKKRELAEKAIEMVKEKSSRFEGLMNIDFEDLHKQMVEGFQVYYPIEQYKSYNAFSSASLDLKKSANVNNMAKSRTSYYQPVPMKAYDFVINPVVLEPSIQVIYQVKLKIVNTPKPKVVAPTPDKEYFIVTNNGDLKKLHITD